MILHVWIAFVKDATRDCLDDFGMDAPMTYAKQVFCTLVVDAPMANLGLNRWLW